MPNFAAPIQDLISRMLCADVDQRISMADVKTHPAFFLDLPGVQYTVPTPLPLPSLEEPVDIASVDQTLMLTLRWIGFDTDAEIIEELQAKEHTSAKAFWYMFVHRFDVRELPWTGDKVPDSDGKLIMPPMKMEQEEPACPVLVSLPSPDVQSLKRSVLTSHVIEREKVVEEAISGLPWRPEELMGLVQIMITLKDYEWFHPNDIEIMASPPSRDFYLVFRVEYVEVELLELVVRGYQTSQDVVLDWIRAIRQAVFEPKTQQSIAP
jgi:hypothetical protein